MIGVVAIGGSLLIGGSAWAATISVTTQKDEFGAGGTKACALREAVEAANSDSRFGGCSRGSGGDRIELRAGTYKLTINDPGSSEDLNAEGDLDVGTTTTIAGRGAGKTAIDGNARVGDERIVHLRAGNLTLLGLTLQNAREYDDDGGAAWNSGPGRMTVRASRVIGNFTDYDGGGLAVTEEGGSLVVERSLVANNVANAYGGALSGYAEGGAITIRNSRLVANTADSSGALITGRGKLTVARSVIADNSAASWAGGIDLYRNAAASVTDSTISGNRVHGQHYGGGINDEDSHGPVRVEDSTISNNHAGGFGGGVYIEHAAWTIRNSTISGNIAQNSAGTVGDGGGIAVYGGSLTLSSATVAYNSAYSGSGIYAGGGATTIRNSIVARNHDFGASEWTRDCTTGGGTISSAGNNLFGDGSCGSVGSDLSGTTADQLFPGLAPLGANGGPTKTHALLAGSPAINKGAGCPKRDQRGVKRGGRCDIGAFER